MRRRVLVTGASRGLGAMLAGLLAEDGAEVFATARGAEDLDAAAQVWRSHGGRVTTLAGDVVDPTHRAALAELVGDRLDLLVHNASTLGPSPLPPLLTATEEQMRRVLETNLVAPLALTRDLAPALVSGDGWIVHVSSDAAHGAYEGWGVYGMSKIALELAARTLGAEEPDLVPIVVDPGDLRTAMHQEAYPGEDISDRPLPEVTAPFWRWLLERPAAEVRGRRYAAQADVWDEPVDARAAEEVA